MTLSPPAWAIAAAERQAQRSPCTKSKRGVVLFMPDPKAGITRPPNVLGVGFNGPPPGFDCAHDEHCGKLCVHAEIRAMRGVTEPGLDMVHVKIGADGHVVAGGPPSCWQCSREIVDSGIVSNVWLYELVADSQCPHNADVRITLCMYCQGEACASHDRCACDVLDRHGASPLDRERWRCYTATQFHHTTLRNVGLL